LPVVFFFQAEDGIRDKLVTGVQTCALPISFLRSLRLLAGRLGFFRFFSKSCVYTETAIRAPSFPISVTTLWLNKFTIGLRSVVAWNPTSKTRSEALLQIFLAGDFKPLIILQSPAAIASGELDRRPSLASA